MARDAKQVTIVVRGDSLTTRMSQYLIEQIEATDNIDVRTNTKIGGAEGTGQLESLILQDSKTGTSETVPAAVLVVLIGAEPYTDWLPSSICRDKHGFVLTGSELTDGENPVADWTLSRSPLSMETSIPGVFAAGDVRSGSVKRVASAVGEGSVAATQLTRYLQRPGQMSYRAEAALFGKGEQR